ncbi:hypothetical protein LTR70_006760 [Exophiala xenobiotica]|uniref:Uncharacterized protein n=1 Tax=Lithohypha guttulata TaxID=1690604 RepID=A0ABR0KAA7_9EURO|nr:hypothetical protein LTR24_005026 [Lithohypha guttulata]KAK5315421.1 hypothetical protein LTR70_006760 [Exophiala xenobiotica]
MPNWRDGLVEAFPIPEDRRPGWKRRARKAAQEAAEAEAVEVSEALSRLDLSIIPSEPFRFFDLPSELRNRIYHYTLFSKPAYRDAKGRRRSSRLAALLVSKKMHDEAAYILYSTTKFPLFFVQAFESPPLVSELATRYQIYVANLKMILGPSWTDPPKHWKVTPRLARCLKRLTAVQTLRVFVEFDPSHPAFEKYRKSYSFYTDFCGDLLGEVLEAMPQLRYVELDGNPGVDVDGPLVSRLRQEAEEEEKEVRWGKQADWAHKHMISSVHTETNGVLCRTASEEADVRLVQIAQTVAT